MPLPIAHSLTGAALAAALHPSASGRRYRLALLGGAFMANAADFDFALVFVLHSPEWHRGFTHSLLFSAVVGLFFALLLGRARLREALGYGLAYASHGVLDWATTKVGGGVELLWPASEARLGLRLWGLSEFPSSLPPPAVLRALLLEILIFAPLLMALLWLKRRASRVKGSEPLPWAGRG